MYQSRSPLTARQEMAQERAWGPAAAQRACHHDLKAPAGQERLGTLPELWALGSVLSDHSNRLLQTSTRLQIKMETKLCFFFFFSNQS